MPRELVVHIGLHKTGTTWLQKEVFSREALGFAQPAGSDRLAATTEFVNVDPVCFDPEQARRRFAPLLEHAAANDLTPVISDERLSSVPELGRYYLPMVMDRLERSFGRFRLLLTVREQESMLLALYRQSIRSGSRMRIREALGTGGEPDGWTPPLNLDFFRYDRMRDYLAGRVGEENLCVLPLELLRADESRYLEELFAFCGVAGGSVATPARNPGLSAFATELQRRANGLLPMKRSAGPPPASIQLWRRALYWINRLSPGGWSERIDEDWRSAVRERVADTFATSNAALAAKTGVDLGALGYRVGGDGSA